MISTPRFHQIISLVFAVFFMAVCLTSVSWADVDGTTKTVSAKHTSRMMSGNHTKMMKGPLDGLKFEGQTGQTGQTNGDKEVVMFQHGMLKSSECAKHGFPKIPYTAKTEGNTTTFTATSTNAKGDQLSWNGTITNGKLDAQLTVTPKGQTATTYWAKADSAPTQPAVHK